MPSVNNNRANVIAEAIRTIPENFFRTLDQEGSYRIFSSAAEGYSAAGISDYDRALSLIGISAGLANYQQLDPVRTFWEPLGRLLRRENFPNSVDHIRRVTVELARSGRIGGQKAGRIEKMFESGFASWFWNSGLDRIRSNPYDAWLRLAGNMGEPPVKKTIVMSMKAFDMETLAIIGEYLKFPPDVPIMVDSRVARITRVSQLVAGFPAISDKEIAAKFRGIIIEGWARVVRKIRETTGDWFSALRLDTLIWWVGKGESSSDARAYLVSKGLDRNLAERCSSALFFRT